MKKCLDKTTTKLWNRIGHNAQKGMQKEKSIEKATGIGRIRFPMKKRRIVS